MSTTGLEVFDCTVHQTWRMVGTPTGERHKEEFLAPIAAAFRGDPEIRPEEGAKGVFALLARSSTPARSAR